MPWREIAVAVVVGAIMSGTGLFFTFSNKITAVETKLKSIPENPSEFIREEVRAALQGEFGDRLQALESTQNKIAASSARTRENTHEISFKGGGIWGEWHAPAFCAPNEFVCGLALRVEGDQRGGDDTAMNDVKAYCCNIMAD